MTPKKSMLLTSIFGIGLVIAIFFYQKKNKNHKIPTKYILDTSAIRGISGGKIKDAAQFVSLYISPISVLELASHLHGSKDSEDPEKKYPRNKGNFMKCAIPEMLDDPFMQLAQKLGTTYNSSRAEDRPVLIELLKAVDQSSTLPELDKKLLKFPNGDIASCKDVGLYVEEGLQEYEAEYMGDVTKWASLLGITSSPLNHKHELSPNSFLSLMDGVVKKQFEYGASGRSYGEVFLSMAPFVGYVANRIYEYANNKTPENTLPIDKNDCEDAYITLSLSFNADTALVTNDQGTLDAIRTTIGLLEPSLQQPINPYAVMSNNEFLKIINDIKSGKNQS